MRIRVRFLAKHRTRLRRTGKSDPLAAAKEPLEGYMQEGDVVEPAGYPDTPERIYCLVRAGNVLATVSLWKDGAGGWLSDTVTGCSELEQ
jgi:hypothetical protein